jgi:hypothetical protein
LEKRQGAWSKEFNVNIISEIPEFRHAGIQVRSVYDIYPSPENDQLYRRIDPSDPEIEALAASIVAQGVLEPLVITEDCYLVSGHRRRAAAVRAGLGEVPCRILPFNRKDDPDQFLVLLREHNRQREKSFDEKLREELVSINPDEAYQALISQRAEKSAIKDTAITITGTKTRAVISAAKQPFLAAIKQVLQELKPYWPVSDRQIHYSLLNDPPLKHASKPDSVYRNDGKSYNALTELLSRARLHRDIPWRAITDETRPSEVWNAHRDVRAFIRDEMQNFLRGYYRDLMQSQPHHIELVVEKNTVLSIIKPIAGQYCIPITSGRGYCSLPPRKAMADRYWKSGKREFILLIASDFDPDGQEIAHSLARSMRDDFGVSRIHAKKVALTQEQVMQFQLPNAMTAKLSSSNADKFINAFGSDTFELEALRPDQLQKIVQEAIDSVIDVDAFNHEVEQERQDAADLEAFRHTVLNAVGTPKD